MARQSHHKTKLTKPATTTKFGKLDYEVYCRFKRAFANWGGTADHTTSIRRVVERQKGIDDDAGLLIEKVGLRVVLLCLQKLLKAKAFCKSTEFTTIFPDVKWPADHKAGSKIEEMTVPTPSVTGDETRPTSVSTTSLGSTGPCAEASSNPPPEGVKPSDVEDSVLPSQGRTGMSKSNRENRQDRVLRPSGGGITKAKAKTITLLRPRLPPNVLAVGDWNKRPLEPERKRNGATRALTIGPKNLSGPEQRRIVEEAIITAKRTLFAHISCKEGASDTKDPLQAPISRYKNEMARIVPKMRFDAFFQAESLAAQRGQIEPLVLAQVVTQCTQDLAILGGYQLHGTIEKAKAKALAGATYWMAERKKELEEQQRQVLEWEDTMKGLLSF
ncbi:hypothetical protein TWF506_005536 [Arthrobotrys conoides]|uniref:Uncharacterized protein n=1 Tax=Arthrobotrys conoides TaxID=74498 RepID=A0AAN8PPX0_9PEZI